MTAPQARCSILITCQLAALGYGYGSWRRIRDLALTGKDACPEPPWAGDFYTEPSVLYGPPRRSTRLATGRILGALEQIQAGRNAWQQIIDAAKAMETP